jgi:hypothetical protein
MAYAIAAQGTITAAIIEVFTRKGGAPVDSGMSEAVAKAKGKSGCYPYNAWLSDSHLKRYGYRAHVEYKNGVLWATLYRI